MPRQMRERSENKQPRSVTSNRLDQLFLIQVGVSDIFPEI